MCIHRCSKGLEIHFTVFNTFLPKLLFTGYILPREDILITVAIMCESDFCKCIIHRPCLKCWDLVCKQLMMNLTHHKRYITMDQKISERDSSFLSLSLSMQTKLCILHLSSFLSKLKLYVNIIIIVVS